MKVGWTKDVACRMLTLRAGCPVPLTFLAALPAYRPLERGLHDAMAKWRLHSEWFVPNPLLEDALLIAHLIGGEWAREEPFDDDGHHYGQVAEIVTWAEGYRTTLSYARDPWRSSL